jgi:OmpA-OmpF porin, OOP family
MKFMRVLAIICLFSCLPAFGQLGGWKSLAKKAVQKSQEKKEQPAPEKKPAEQATATNPSPSPNSGAAPTASGGANAGAAATTTTGATTGGQPQLVGAKIDFIPGEKTVFNDDLSDMPPGEPPPHWKTRGGAAELFMGGGIRELRPTAATFVTLISQPIGFPQNFTFEAVFTGRDGTSEWSFLTRDEKPVLHMFLRLGTDGKEIDLDTVEAPPEVLGRGDWTPMDTINPVQLAVWAQQGRVRVYLNGRPFVDSNQVKLGPIDHIQLQVDARSGPFGLRSVRVAECAPDPGAMFATTGKYVTHGIYFDTDSDILKPESAPVIKEISTALYKSPGLKLEIDGYTDSTGEAAHNLDLSKRRAAAVASVLVSQFGIDQSRLSSNGFGVANPIASNDTSDGRAQNRRVEFVKK